MQQQTEFHLDSLRNYLKEKVVQEVVQLEARVRELDQSDRIHKNILIDTYRKVIDSKQSLLRQL